MSYRNHMRIVSAAVVLSTVAVLFLLTTSQTACDGGFPAGEYWVTVRGPDGRPIPGARLRVLHAGDGSPAFGYPIDNYTADHPLIADDRGRIVAVRKHGGFQFGWTEWNLFGVYKVRDGKAPEYRCEVTADGFRPATFDVWQLFGAPSAPPDDHPRIKVKEDRHEYELPVFDLPVVLGNDR